MIPDMSKCIGMRSNAFEYIKMYSDRYIHLQVFESILSYSWMRSNAVFCVWEYNKILYRNAFERVSNAFERIQWNSPWFYQTHSNAFERVWPFNEKTFERVRTHFLNAFERVYTAYIWLSCNIWIVLPD
jgi:hypothetical protein